MSTKTVETITIEAVNLKPHPKTMRFNAGGVLVNDTWLNVKKGIEMSQFSKGQIVDVEVETNDKGYRTIVGLAGGAKAATLPPVPSLPVTTSHKTEAPGGEVPVRPANKTVAPSSTVMSKEEWRAKDRSIALLSIVGKVLTSPVYGQLAIGRNTKEVLDIGNQLVDHFVSKLDSLS